MKERRYTDEEAAFWRAQVEVKDTQLQAHRAFVAAFEVWRAAKMLPPGEGQCTPPFATPRTAWDQMMDALKVVEA